MKATLYVVATRREFRVLKNEPKSLKSNERAVKITVEIPDSAFDAIRMPEVVVSIPAESVKAPVFTPEVRIEGVDGIPLQPPAAGWTPQTDPKTPPPGREEEEEEDA